VGNCPSSCRRREIRSLSDPERNAYFAAVHQLHSGPAPTKYDQMVKIHLDATDYAHNTAYFLPWHRGYLRTYEKALQAIDPSVCVPYWNWSVDSQAPEYSPVFTEGYFGTNGGADGCVADGQFKGWQVNTPQPHCLKRKWKYGDNLGAFHSYEGVNKIVTQSSSYDSFRSRLESLAHPTPHINIGGDMAEMYSPNDPIFWSHHAYIDYVWTQYQKIKGYDFAGPNEKGGKAQKSDKSLGLDYSVQDVMDYKALCYEYVDMKDTELNGQELPPAKVNKPASGQKPDMVTVVPIPANEDDRYSSKDRSNLNILRYPDEADEDWCRKNKYDIPTVRQYESDHKQQVYKKLNQVKGYVSPCSLWKRPTLCTSLIEKKKDLCVDIPDYGRVNVGYKPDVKNAYQAYSNVKQRVEYCSSDVELPANKYAADVQNIIGKSAFDGAGTLKKVLTENDVKSSAPRIADMTMLAAMAVPVVMAGVF
jgi:tyrosinase